MTHEEFLTLEPPREFDPAGPLHPFWRAIVDRFDPIAALAGGHMFSKGSPRPWREKVQVLRQRSPVSVQAFAQAMGGIGADEARVDLHNLTHAGFARRIRDGVYEAVEVTGV